MWYTRTKLVATAVFIALIVCGYQVWVNSDGVTFYKAYQQLRIGMPKSRVQQLFGTTPTYAYSLNAFDIWYYKSKGIHKLNGPVDVPVSGSRFQSADDLPDLYDYVTIAFDENEKVHAFTWIGETYTVESVDGPVNGTHFKLLPKKTFD